MIKKESFRLFGYKESLTIFCIFMPGTTMMICLYVFINYIIFLKFVVCSKSEEDALETTQKL